MDSEPVIVIDTREQRPWAFPEYVRTKVAMLPAGDYALEGDEHFAIERKSLDDFIGTVFSGWERFRRELSRMKAAGFPARLVIVEADYEQLVWRESSDGRLVAPQHNHFTITPQAVAARLGELALSGVCVLFCKDPGHAAMQAYYTLMERFKCIRQ